MPKSSLAWPCALRPRRELLAPRPDVWDFLAEPFHLADWWPGISGVQPDRRGLGRGARWQVVAAAEPTLLRRPEARGDARRDRRRAGPGSSPSSSTGEKLDVRVELEATAADRTRATITVEGPWLIAYRPRRSPEGGRSPVRAVPDCGDSLTPMFDLRYHVASLAAVFLALIIGILVGVGISREGLRRGQRAAALQRADRRL